MFQINDLNMATKIQLLTYGPNIKYSPSNSLSSFTRT